MRRLPTFLLFLLTVYFPSLCIGAVHYASPTGSAIWSQSTNISTPCSITTAMSNAQAGDTVYLRGGTYATTNKGAYDTPSLSPTNSGSAGSPIVFGGYQNETATFVPGNPSSHVSPLLGVNSKNYITFRKITVDTTGATGGGSAAFWIYGADHVVIENCILIGHTVTDSDVHWGAIMAYEYTTNLTVKNNKMYNWNASGGANSAGITIFNNKYLIVEHNEIYNCCVGINDCEAGYYNEYRYNYIHDITARGISAYLQDGVSGNNVKIFNNIIANITNSSNEGNRGIILDNIGSGMAYNNYKIYNNVLYNASGIALSHTSGVEVWNNIIWNSSSDSELGSMIWHFGSTEDPTYIDYNCYWPNQRFGIHIYTGSAVYYTTLAAWTSGHGYDSHSKHENPLFVDSSGGAIGFKLQAGSPALDAGIDRQDYDGDGNTTERINMGAYITGNEIIGLVSVSECQNWQTLHPEWIFCDDFVDGTPLVRSGRYFDYDDAGGRFTLASGVGTVGTDNSNGMKAVWSVGDVNVGNLYLSFGRNPGAGMSNGIRTSEDFREIYYRMYLKQQSGWQGNPAKLSRATVIAASDWSQAMIAHIWGDDTTHLSLDPASCVVGSTVQCVGYNDFGHLVWLGQQSGTTAIFDGQASHNDRWYCIEGHVKLNDPGVSNGIQEFWIDGVLETRKTGLNFVGSYTSYGINAIFFENYWNAGATKQEERYFDNIVVSTQRIGCLGDTTPPSPPKNLRVIP
jgi:hypothetical protein